MDSKKIRYTRHARKRLRWRNILQQDVEGCISQPDFAEDSLRGRKNVWRKVDGKYLRVTYRENDEIVVITAVLKSKGPRG